MDRNHKRTHQVHVQSASLVHMMSQQTSVHKIRHESKKSTCQGARGEHLKGFRYFDLCVSLCWTPGRNPLKDSHSLHYHTVAQNKLLRASQPECVLWDCCRTPLIYTHTQAVTSINDDSWLCWSHVTTAARLSNGPYVFDKCRDRMESLLFG